MTRKTRQIQRRRFASAEKGQRALPSYKDPYGSPTTRLQWNPHEGKKQKLRNLRNVCKDIISSKDPEILEVIQRARELVAGKFEEYGLLMMIYQAKEISDSTGLHFVECLNYIVDKMKGPESAEKSDSVDV